MAACPGLRVLVLTMHADPSHLRAALAAGAAGYMLKSGPMAGVLAAVRAAGGPDPADRPAPPTDALARGEREVFDLLVRGHTHREVADLLFLSVKSVNLYRRRIRAKTGLRTRADFVRHAAPPPPAGRLRRGLVEQPTPGGPPDA